MGRISSPHGSSGRRAIEKIRRRRGRAVGGTVYKDDLGKGGSKGTLLGVRYARPVAERGGPSCQYSGSRRGGALVPASTSGAPTSRIKCIGRCAWWKQSRSIGAEP